MPTAFVLTPLPSPRPRRHEVIRETLPQLRSLGAIQLSQAEVFACCEILCYYDLIALRKYGKAVKPGFTLLVSNTTQRRTNVKLYLSIVFYALRFLNSGFVIFPMPCVQ